MRWIVQASLRFRFLVAAGAVLLIAVGTLQIPNMRVDAFPEFAPTRVMQIGMSSKDHTLIAMSMMAYWTIRARLLRVPGVANVAIWGERLQNLTVQVDPKRMQSHEVTLGAVMEATSDSVDHGLLKFTTASVIGTGGAIDTGTQLVGIQHVLPIVAPADLARATVESKNGTSVPIGDVAEVKEDHQPLIGDAVIGDSPGLLLVLCWRGETVNTMTLAGLVIALGSVVDDAVIGVENILRRLRQHRRAGSAKSTASIILEASLEVRRSIVYATLIIVAAAVPIFLLEGLTGAFFRPLAVSYWLAILASMVVALTFTPALCLILLREAHVERRDSPITRWLQGGYTALLSRIVHRPGRAYAAFIAPTLIAVIIAPHLGTSLFPEFREPDFLIHFITTPGTSAVEQQRMIVRLSGDLRSIPGVRSFGSHIGQAFLGEEIAGVNFGENWISTDPNMDRDQIVEEISAVTESYPGVYRDVQTYLNERIEEVLTGAKEPIVIRIYGSDTHVLHAAAD